MLFVKFKSNLTHEGFFFTHLVVLFVGSEWIGRPWAAMLGVHGINKKPSTKLSVCVFLSLISSTKKLEFINNANLII